MRVRGFNKWGGGGGGDSKGNFYRTSPGTNSHTAFANFGWNINGTSTQKGSNTKHLLTGPRGNSEVCFPESLNVPLGLASGNIEVEGKKFTVPRGANHLVFCYTSQLKSRKKTAKKSFPLRRLAQKFGAVSRSTTWSRASRKFMLLFPLEVSEFWHVTRFPPIGKRIWVGRYNKTIWWSTYSKN